MVNNKDIRKNLIEFYEYLAKEKIINSEETGLSKTVRWVDNFINRDLKKKKNANG